jgi:hypothetical protein
MKVGAVTPLAVTVTPLVWGKDYPHRGKKVKSSVNARLATHGVEAAIDVDDFSGRLGEPI